MSKTILLALCIASISGVAQTAFATQTLSPELGENLDKGMKQLAKGLGAKCSSCHVKDDYESDKKKNKRNTREFIQSVIDNTDAEKRQASLKKLLEALKIKRVRSEASLWAAFKTWKVD